MAFWRYRVRRGYRHCRHPTAALPPVGSCSGPQVCCDRQFLQGHVLGEKLHSLGHISGVYLSYMNNGLDVD